MRSPAAADTAAASVVFRVVSDGIIVGHLFDFLLATQPILRKETAALLCVNGERKLEPHWHQVRHSSFLSRFILIELAVR